MNPTMIELLGSGSAVVANIAIVILFLKAQRSERGDGRKQLDALTAALVKESDANREVIRDNTKTQGAVIEALRSRN